MALPERIMSINAPDTVMYDGDMTVSWGTSEGAESYRLYISNVKGNGFTEIYRGSDTEYTFNMLSYPEHGKIRFRVYGENAEGRSPFPCESREVTVIDIEIREGIDGEFTLLPFNMTISMTASKFGDVPAVRETSEQITGLDGEIPIDMKYSPRLFDISAFMKWEFASVAEREAYMRRMSAHIDRSVRQLRYLLYRGKIFGVKRISSEFGRKPAYCTLDISYKCYEVYGYGSEEHELRGDGVCSVSGDMPCCPVIILEGEKNNPALYVNGVKYQIALDTSAGDAVYIDCGRETVLLEAADGSRRYLAGAFYLDFPIFHVGENAVSGCDAVRWREKWFGM